MNDPCRFPGEGNASRRKRGGTDMSRSLLSLAVIGAAVTPACHRVAAQDAPGSSVTVVTASGPVSGTSSASVTTFKGIPYAAPPVGTLRWRAPEPVAPWTVPLVANDYGYSCMQPLPVPGTRPGSRSASVSEDCLTLNIWTPATRTAPLPVMIWIHGGGNTEGTSGRTLYDGSTFARDSVVFVSFNYRLGVFGFLAHPAFTREAGAAMTGNYALLDQLAAIRWVRRNIVAFGGDTSRITVFGESAGGQDILALLTSMPARGLVTRVIAESPGGGWMGPPSLAAAERAGTGLMTKLGLAGPATTVEQMRALSADTVLRAADESSATGPILDGKLLAEAPLAAFADGHSAAIPIIVGTNSDEGSLIAGTGRGGDGAPALLDSLARIRTLYGPAAGDDESFVRVLFRDAYFAGPARWIASHASAPVFLYRFDYVVTPLRAARRGASHGSELPFVFQNWPIPLAIPADQAIARAMHECWVTFARTGAPTCEGLPHWTPYRPADGQLMLVDGDPGMRDNPVAGILDLLERRFHL